jgi:serine/threonine-protein kinase
MEEAAMSADTPARPSDRNLLFGILALQMDFVSRDQLIAAMHAWVLDKGQPLGDILVRQGALAEPEQAALEVLVQQHLRRHGDDPARSLAALPPAPAVRQHLERVADADLHASLLHVPTTVDPGATPGPPNSLATQGTTTGLPTSAGGRFQVLRPHAEGGLGAVFVARDTELNREVALKEIQQRHADHPESRARFLLEAEITGGLEHPGIVPVYGLGAYPDGRPFYVMRFIKGQSLHEAIRAFHQQDKQPRDPGQRSLALRGLLRRFIDVCNAVAYAHSRGVIHRDLKPANVMLGPFGETLVVDWGLAKPVGRPEAERAGDEETLRPASASGPTPTQMGQTMGTPAYMSPEQALGRLDRLGPASDVYSLGAVLYVLLTGQSPFPNQEAGPILARVQHGDFPPPRAVQREAPPALEAVCLKAMALQPEDRYPSARALASEVEHWLADEPVAAYPEPWAARARRWVGCHRTLVTSAAAALIVAAVSLATATTLLTRAYHNEKQATERATTQEQQARADFELAREAVESFGRKVSNDPRLKEKDLETLRRDLLRSAIEFHKKFADRHADDPQLRADLGRTYLDLARLTRSLGETNEAIALCRQCLAVFEELAAADPDNNAHAAGLGGAHADLGRALTDAGQMEAAGRELAEAVRVLEQARSRDGRDCKVLEELSWAYDHQGVFLSQGLGKAEAIDAFRKGARVTEELTAAAPDITEYALRNIDFRYYLAAHLNGQEGKASEAADLCENACRALEGILRQDKDNLRARQYLANVCHVLALAYANLGRRDLAIRSMERSIEVGERVVAEHPGLIDPQQNLGRSLNNLGMLHARFHEPKQAVAAYLRALEVKEKVAARSPGVPDFQADLARTLVSLANFVEDRALAVDYQRRAATILRDLTNRFPDVLQYKGSLAHCTGALGRLLDGEQKWPQAEKAHQEAIQAQLAVVVRSGGNVTEQQGLSQMYRALTNHYLAQKHYGEAIGAMEQAAAWDEKVVRANPNELAYRLALVATYEALSQVCIKGGRFKEAGGALERAAGELAELARRQPEAAEHRRRLANVRLNQGVAHFRQGTLTESARSYREAAVVLEKLDLKQPAVAKAQAQLAGNVAALAQALPGTEEMAGASGEASRLYQALADAHPQKVEYQAARAGVLDEMGKQLWQRKQPARALVAFGDSGKTWEKLAGNASSDQYKMKLAANVGNAANCLLDLGQTREAATQLRRSIAVLKDLSQAHPDNDDYHLQAAQGLNNLGVVHYNLREMDKAAEAFGGAADALEVLVRKHPDSAWNRATLFNTLVNRGAACNERGDLDVAAQAYDRAVALFDKLDLTLALSARDAASLAGNLTAQGRSYEDKGQPDKAARAYRQALVVCGRLRAAFPREVAHDVTLGGAHCNLGNALCKVGKTEEALPEYAKGIAVLAPLAAADKSAVPNARLFLRNCHLARAHALVALRRYEAALPDWEQAVGLTDGPGRNVLRLEQADCLARAGRHAQAAAEADMAIDQPSTPAELLFNAARVHSLAVAWAAKDDKLLEAQRKELAERYATRAVALLHEAVRKGLADTTRLGKDADLEALRPREDFRRFLKELEAPKK